MNNQLDWAVCGRMIANPGLIVIKSLVLSLILSGLEIGPFRTECVGLRFKVLGDYALWSVVYWIVPFHLTKLLSRSSWAHAISIGAIFLRPRSGLTLVCASRRKVLFHRELFRWVESVPCLIRTARFWFVFGGRKLRYLLKRTNRLSPSSWIFSTFAFV